MQSLGPDELDSFETKKYFKNHAAVPDPDVLAWLAQNHLAAAVERELEVRRRNAQ